MTFFRVFTKEEYAEFLQSQNQISYAYDRYIDVPYRVKTTQKMFLIETHPTWVYKTKNKTVDFMGVSIDELTILESRTEDEDIEHPSVKIHIKDRLYVCFKKDLVLIDD